MTVAATGDYSGPFAPDGVTTAFPFDFAALSADEIAVLRMSTAGAQTILSGYTVTLNDDESGGSVLFGSPPLAGDPLYIASDPSFEQQTTFSSQSSYSPKSLGKALDRGAVRDIALQAALSRAALAPPTETLGVLPPAAVRAGNFFAFNADGDATVASGTGADAGLRTDIAASSGAALVGFTRVETGAVARLLQSKARDFAHALDFGLLGSGDESAKLTAFVNSAIANPGTPHQLEAKTYGTSVVLPTISVSNVFIQGAPGDVHSVGSYFSGTVIKWVGSASANPILSVVCPAGSGNQFLSGIRLRGFGVDCNSLAAVGIRIQTVRQSEFDLCGANATSRLFDLGVIAGALGENQSLQTSKFRLRARQVESSAPCLYLDGSTVANVSMNEIWCDFLHGDSPAIVCANSDNNDWHFVRTYSPGAATESIQLLGGPTNIELARSEFFHHVTTNKPIKAYGTDAYTVASFGHRIFAVDLDNSTPTPVIGTGAWIDCEMGQAYTPTVTGAAGSGLTTGTILGSYIRTNNFVDVDVSVVVSAGTGYTSLTLTLPYIAVGAIGQTTIVVEAGSSSKTFSGYIAPGTKNLVIHSADGTTALPTGTYSASVRYRVR